MSFETESDEGSFSNINITPFVDVVLVLLIIFMITAPMMIKSAIELQLPAASSTDKIERETLGVTILKSGNVMLNGALISPEQLSDEVKSALSKDPKAQVVIIADKMSTHGMVVELIDLVKSAGVTNFAFQVEKKRN